MATKDQIKVIDYICFHYVMDAKEDNVRIIDGVVVYTNADEGDKILGYEKDILIAAKNEENSLLYRCDF
jgi:hypothetical protein